MQRAELKWSAVAAETVRPTRVEASSATLSAGVCAPDPALDPAPLDQALSTVERCPTSSGRRVTHPWSFMHSPPPV